MSSDRLGGMNTTPVANSNNAAPSRLGSLSGNHRSTTLQHRLLPAGFHHHDVHHHLGGGGVRGEPVRRPTSHPKVMYPPSLDTVSKVIGLSPPTSDRTEPRRIPQPSRPSKLSSDERESETTHPTPRRGEIASAFSFVRIPHTVFFLFLFFYFKCRSPSSTTLVCFVHVTSLHNHLCLN